MAVWEVRVVLAFGDREWENVYHIDAGTSTDVDASIVEAFQDFYLDRTLSTYILKRIVRRVLGSTDAFIEITIDVPGSLSPGVNIPAPLFNTVRMLLDSGAGRPGSKFLRGMLLQNNLIDSSGTIDPDIISQINVSFDNVLNAAAEAGQDLVFGADDKHVVSSSFQGSVQERQRHRKRKKTV